MRRTYKYRLYPSPSQAQALAGQLEEARVFYNAALAERREAWRMAGKSLSFYDQSYQIKAIRADGNITLANYQACTDVLLRVDRAFNRFFARCKRGGKAGYPRFKSRLRFDSYTFPAYGNGCKLRPNGRLYIQGVGEIKLKLHRAISGQIKTVTLKREAGRWYVCFSVVLETPLPLVPTGKTVGIDVGILSFAALSDGSVVENPRHYRTAQVKLRRSQRKVSRREKGSNRRRKAAHDLKRGHAHVKNQRSNFHHQVSRKLVKQYDQIFVEDLNIKGLASGMLAKSVHDAGWGSFLSKLAYKAEEAGRVLVRVNPNGSSQRCPCGTAVPKRLSQRWHQCLVCGMSVSRDHASALEILRLGLSLQALTQPVAASVA